MKPKQYQKLLDEAGDWMAEFKAEYAETRNPKIIVDMIKKYPWSLEAPWVHEEVIKWLLDLPRYEFALKAAFTHKTRYKHIKDRPTDVRGHFLVKEIDRIMREEKPDKGRGRVSLLGACRRLAHRQDDNPRPIAPKRGKDGSSLAETIRKAYLRQKEQEGLPEYGRHYWYPEFPEGK